MERKVASFEQHVSVMTSRLLLSLPPLSSRGVISTFLPSVRGLPSKQRGGGRGFHWKPGSHVFQRLRLSNGDESATLGDLLRWRRVQCEGRGDCKHRPPQTPPSPTRCSGPTGRPLHDRGYMQMQLLFLFHSSQNHIFLGGFSLFLDQVTSMPMSY
ncbi:hypothetical protein F7725_001989, partial [Dissostichus mawsoni]